MGKAFTVPKSMYEVEDKTRGRKNGFFIGISLTLIILLGIGLFRWLG